MKTINFGKKSIKVVKRKHSKYMRLRVSPVGEIKLTVPVFTPKNQINEFLDSQKPWLKQVLKNVKPSRKLKLVNGETIEILDHTFKLKFYKKHANPKAYIETNTQTIHVFSTNNKAEIKALVKNTLIEHARKLTKHKSKYFVNRLDIDYKKISIREQRSRWGSCSTSGNLNFNWKIILAPRSVFNYVIAHEVSHLIEHNHSKNFWTLVEKLHPNYKKDKDWLKTHANELEIF
jgi:predicted metal-dependent hydrolase